MLFKNRLKEIHVPEIINYSDLIIREYNNNIDKINLFSLLNDYRRDYYINVYKLCFKSWFTYVLTAIFMSIIYLLLNNSAFTLFIPPLIVTIYLLYKVNKYRCEYNRVYTIHDVENITLGSSSTLTGFKRKQTQGVYICLYKSTLVAYCIYKKQEDENQTVCIKEMCVRKEFRQRKIATYFMDYLCKNLFKSYSYKRLTFTISDLFHPEMNKCCIKKNDLILKVYSWFLYRFVPGISDIRTVYAIDFKDIYKMS